MALLRTFNKFYTGSFWQFTYSPMYPDRLSVFDRYPLMLFFNYNTNIGVKSGRPLNLISGVNFHFLLPSQRIKLIEFLITHYKQNKAMPFEVDQGKPIFLSYQILKHFMPEAATIAWRRYFPNRMRTIKQVAIDWNFDELKNDIINSDTEKLIGVDSAFLQQLWIRQEQDKLRKIRGMEKLKRKVK